MPKTKIEPPQYVLDLQAEHVGLTHLGAERSILRAWKAEYSQKGQGPYGRTFTEHMRDYIRLTCPKTDLHEFTIQIIESFELTAFIKKKQILNVIGSKNSGKTDTFATLAMTILSIWPEYTTIYVAAPYRNSADSTIWGRIRTRMKQMKRMNPELWKDVVYIPSKDRIVFENHEESGFCEVRTLDKIGKLQGTKSYDDQKGWLLLFCDEIALFPSRALLDLLDNLTGNENFFCFDGCNFKDTEGLEGDLCRPQGRDYSELSLEEDHEWDSDYESYTLRLDGHRSPNILAGEIIYSYLLKEHQRQAAENTHGLLGPKYMEQIRSFPNSSVSDFYVTTKDKVRSGGGWDEFVFDKGNAVRVAACDPGFGGDPCKIGAFEYSNARIQDSEGEFHTVPIFMPLAPIHTIKVEVQKIADQEWLDRLHKQSEGKMFLREGQEITIENQIAVQCGEFLDQWGIPKSHFGFDGSMRAGIVQEMIAVLKGEIKAIDFGGNATDRIGDLTGQKEAKELYDNFVTEMYFNFAKLVQAGQFRGAEFIPAAIHQICNRKWKSSKGNKKQVEPKADYKKGNKGKSPDDADVLVLALEMALRIGFMGVKRGRPDNMGGIAQIMGMISNSKRFRRRTVKSLSR